MSETEVKEKELRNKIQKIIELTAHEMNGEVWGNDTCIDTMENLIDKALEILNK